EYAVEAFELNVVDYLVKPITTSRFLQAIEKAREVLASGTEQVSIEPDEFIFIRDGNIIRRIKADDILYAEAMGDYVKIHLPNKFYAIHTTLKSVEERLATHRFVRVHRSYIVGINKIDGIQDGALVVNGKSLPVADAYRSSLNKRLNIL
ncbi:MAG: response regulator transcription factor, partial [Chitinophagaceae bacterium]|nr:response regulator transcription factor [Chitinophagaceae bacterium]